MRQMKDTDLAKCDMLFKVINRANFSVDGAECVTIARCVDWLYEIRDEIEKDLKAVKRGSKSKRKI